MEEWKKSVTAKESKKESRTASATSYHCQERRSNKRCLPNERRREIADTANSTSIATMRRLTYNIIHLSSAGPPSQPAEGTSEGSGGGFGVGVLLTSRTATRNLFFCPRSRERRTWQSFLIAQRYSRTQRLLFRKGVSATREQRPN